MWTVDTSPANEFPLAENFKNLYVNEEHEDISESEDEYEAEEDNENPRGADRDYNAEITSDSISTSDLDSENS